MPERLLMRVPVHPRLRAIALHHQMEASTAVAATCYGAWLAAPWWQTFAVSRAYVLLARLGPEWAWGAGICAVGVLQGAALWAGRPRLRLAGCALGVVLWCFLALFTGLAAGWQNAGVVFFLQIAGANALIYLALGRHVSWRRGRLTPADALPPVPAAPTTPFRRGA